MHLVKREALARIGGFAAIRGEVIDDCALAKAVKLSGGKVWMGLTRKSASLRAYGTFGEIRDLIARTAFTQLRYSGLILAGTLAGMFLTYVAPLLLLFAHDSTARVLGFAAWLLMSLSFLPTVRFYRSVAAVGAFAAVDGTCFIPMRPGYPRCAIGWAKAGCGRGARRRPEELRSRAQHAVPILPRHRNRHVSLRLGQEFGEGLPVVAFPAFEQGGRRRLWGSLCGRRRVWCRSLVRQGRIWRWNRCRQANWPTRQAWTMRSLGTSSMFGPKCSHRRI